MVTIRLAIRVTCGGGGEKRPAGRIPKVISQRDFSHISRTPSASRAMGGEVAIRFVAERVVVLRRSVRRPGREHGHRLG